MEPRRKRQVFYTVNPHTGEKVRCTELKPCVDCGRVGWVSVWADAGDPMRRFNIAEINIISPSRWGKALVCYYCERIRDKNNGTPRKTPRFFAGRRNDAPFERTRG